MFEEALDLVRQLEDEALEGFVLGELACARQASMRMLDVIEAGRRAAELLRRAGDLWGVATTLGFVELALILTGRFDGSVTVGEELAPLAERIGNYPALYTHGRARGMREFFAAADLDALEAFARWDLDFGERTGLQFTGHSYSWFGLVEFLRGNWDAAFPLFEKGATIGDRMGAINGFSWALLFLHHVYAGDKADALAFYEDRRTDLPLPGQPNSWAAWTLLLAFTEGLAILGSTDEVAGFYPLILEAKSTGAVVTSYHEGRLLERIIGIAAAAAEQWDAAEQHFEAALGQAEELPHRLEQLETRRFYARMLVARDRRGDRNRAQEMLAKAATGYAVLGIPRHAELTRQALDPLKR
jgi:tetratricopeptide (TPR) repeat protein